MAIPFRLWVLDTVGLTDVKREDLRNLTDRNFMIPLRGVDMAAGNVRVVGLDEAIAPGRFDAVVFLTTIGFRGAGSIMKLAGVSPEEAIENESIEGLTDARLKGGGIAEVYWNRCETLSQVASAIFHEAGHLKFQETFRDQMHGSVGSDGKTKVHILGKHLGKGFSQLPNIADIQVFKSKIPNVIVLRTRMPA